MIELLAVAPEDGWAYVKEDAEVRLIRPPFTRSLSSIVSEQWVENAVSKHGFVRPGEHERSFDDWPTLLQFLGKQMRSALTARDVEIAENAAERLLEFATPETLNRYLARIDAELIPNGRWDHAESLLLNMLCLPALRDVPESHGRAVMLLKKVQEGRRREREAKRGLADEDLHFDQVFPRASARYGREGITRVADQIAARGHVFAFS